MLLEVAFRGDLVGQTPVVGALARTPLAIPLKGTLARPQFDAAAVDAEFFAGTNIRTNFICSLGYGDPAALFPRSPRPGFEEVCRIL